MKPKKVLRDGESNPGLPRDRRGYSPLYYRGDVHCARHLMYKTSLYIYEMKIPNNTNLIRTLITTKD